MLPRWMGLLFGLASTLACGPVIVFPPPAADQFFVFGRTDIEAEFPGALSTRRRLRFRAFNHFLHPFEEITWTLSPELGPGPGTLQVVLEDGLSPIHATGTPIILRHRMGEAFEADVSSSDDAQLLLTVEAVFAEASLAEAPPPWASRPLELVVEEVDPTDRPFGGWRYPNDGGALPPFPLRSVRCGEHSEAAVRLEGSGVPLELEHVEPIDGWLHVRTAEVTAVEVQFGDLLAPELERLDRRTTRARIPLLPSGPVSIEVRSGEARAVLDETYTVPRQALEEHPRPSSGPVTAALDDGRRRLVATEDEILEVSLEGYRDGPFGRDQPFGIRDLLLSEEPPAMWAATDVGLLVSLGDQPFVRRGEGRFRGVSEPGAGVIAAVGAPALALAWEKEAKFERWPAELEPRDVFFDDTAGHPRAFAVIDDGSVWLSPDGGRSPWKRLPPIEVRDLVEAPTQCGTLIAASPQGSWQSAQDDPERWSRSGPRLERVLTTGARLFGAGPDGIWEWRTPGWRKLASLPEEAAVRALSVSPDGARLDVHTHEARFELRPRLEEAQP